MAPLMGPRGLCGDSTINGSKGCVEMAPLMGPRVVWR